MSGHTQIRETIEARASSPSSCERRGTHHRLSKRPEVSEQNIVVIVSSGAEFPQGSTNYPIPHLASQEFGTDRSSAEKNREIRNTTTTWTENARTRDRESNRIERFFNTRGQEKTSATDGRVQHTRSMLYVDGRVGPSLWRTKRFLTSSPPSCHVHVRPLERIAES